MKDYFTKKEQIVILVLALVIVFILGFKFLNKPDSEFEIQRAYLKDNLEEDLEKKDKEPIEEVEEEIKEIMIHISGEVYNPGLVKLESGNRLIDAVELAGGLKKDADLDKINLARKLQDEDKVYIPKIGEDVDVEIEALSVSSGNPNNSVNSKININKCTKAELITLSGIGDATADKIIDYRNKNKFNKIEDIMNVSGIGEKKFSSIKDLIIVK